MKFLLLSIGLFLIICEASGQQDSVVLPASSVMDLNSLITEVTLNNPEIKAASDNVDQMYAKIPQTSTLDAPTLEFMQEGFPDLKFSEAMFSRIRLMQMIPFPGKLSKQEDLGNIVAEHSAHDQIELTNEIITNLKTMYFELWDTQQAAVLISENIRLMKQFSEIALSNYSVGKSSQQDVLKAEVEIEKLKNQLTDLRAKEIGTKSMMQSLLNRSSIDTLGYATIPEVEFLPYNLDTLESLALENRQMLKHDSLKIVENETMLKVSKQDYLPDFTFLVERMTSPTSSFNGWSVSAGITLPFAPWSIAKSDSRVQEADLGVKKANESYLASKNMVLGNIVQLNAKILGLKKQLDSYSHTIIPTAQQSLNVSLSLYQSGKTDFLMLIDAFRSLTDFRMEYYELRMQFEQSIASLEQMVGTQDIIAQN